MSAPVNAVTYRFPAPRRLIAIGDLHGDLAAARAALKLGGALGPNDEWIGKDLVVVQTGDQIDRGDDDRAVLDLFDALRDRANARGGVVHALNGNHETLNVELDFRYVTPGANAAFADLAGAAPSAALERFEPALRGRVAAFLPGAVYARRLAKRNTIAIVGESVFVHGGVLPEHVRYDLGRINAEISAWMRGESGAPPASVRDPSSPIWTRAYGAPSLDEDTCRVLKETLGALRVQRMVIGHTVQEAGINAACAGAVWRIDAGLSSFYRPTRVEVLAIEGDRVEVLRAPRDAVAKQRATASQPRAVVPP